MYRLLFWLRHSKMDRVELDELDEAYQVLQKEVKTTDPVALDQMELKSVTEASEAFAVIRDYGEGKKKTPDEPEQKAIGDSNTPLETSGIAASNRLVSKNELRETVKQRADIHESPVQES
ncbi:hypothetical protein EGW08_006523, partial [Elysia chlorotica]